MTASLPKLWRADVTHRLYVLAMDLRQAERVALRHVDEDIGAEHQVTACECTRVPQQIAKSLPWMDAWTAERVGAQRTCGEWLAEIGQRRHRHDR